MCIRDRHYARSADDEMFHDELNAIAAECPWVSMVLIYTREPAPGAELAGRFNIDHLKHHGIDIASTPTYLCGPAGLIKTCLLYTSDAADDLTRVDTGGRRIIKKQ